MKNWTEEEIKEIRWALAVLNRGDSIILNRGEKQKIILAARVVEAYGIVLNPETGDWEHEAVKNADL